MATYIDLAGAPAPGSAVRVWRALRETSTPAPQRQKRARTALSARTIGLTRTAPTAPTAMSTPTVGLTRTAPTAPVVGLARTAVGGVGEFGSVDLAAGLLARGRLTADDVAGARFPVTTFREGYRQREVDAFLARAAVSLRERASGRVGPLSADDVVVVAFPPSRILPGYEQTEVDDFLDRLVEAFV